MVFARRLRGPRVKGRLLKVQGRPAATHRGHGETSEHFILRSLQPSQAHFPIFLVGVVIGICTAHAAGLG